MLVQKPHIKEDWTSNVYISSSGMLTHVGEYLHAEEVRHGHMHYQVDHRKFTTAMFNLFAHSFQNCSIILEYCN